MATSKKRCFFFVIRIEHWPLAIRIGIILCFFLIVFLLPRDEKLVIGELKAGLNNRVIGIDPGHGGIDVGTYHYPTGSAEKTITLEISKRLAQIISEAGGIPVLAREDDIRFAESPREDLRYRISQLEAQNVDCIISIHVNYYPSSSPFGPQVFYYPTNPQGKRLALLIQEELLAVRPDNQRQAVPENFFVLRETTLSSVLVEVGFMSNPKDRQLMQEATGQNKIAIAIARGISRFFMGEQPKPVITEATDGPLRI
ncbi:MAG: N-acetylmuramoyl-L-alanine amidase [Limnochordia bacterium]|nr:N-acetylmuramoyl-L-alanine amidase [Limnochordia bacterium]